MKQQKQNSKKIGSNTTQQSQSRLSPIGNAKLNSFNSSQNAKSVLGQQKTPIKNAKSKKSFLKKSRSPSRSQAYDQPDDEYDNIRMINQSMMQLQDPKFIANQIDDFQNRLNINQKKQTQRVQGFCQMTREKSLKLSNTQAYRKYKKQIQQITKNQMKLQNSKDSIKLEKDQNKQNIKKQQKDQNKKEEENKANEPKKQKQTKKQQDSSDSSLSYSSDSRQRYRNKKLKNQSVFSINNNSDVTNKGSIEQDIKINNDSTISQQYNLENQKERIQYTNLQKNHSL